MSRIDDLISECCPEGIEVRPLGQVGQFIRGNGLQKKDFVDEGVGCIHYGQIYTHYGTSATETKTFVSPGFAAKLRSAAPGDLVVATTSENDADVAKAVAWLGDDPVAVSGDAYVFKHSLDPLYVSYFFQTDSFQQQKRRFITGTKVKRVSGADLARIEIPVPPVTIQREIASVLTRMEALEAELEAELEARRRQYFHYRDALLAFDSLGTEIEWMTLGDVCTRVSSGGTPQVSRREYYDEGTIPWLRTQEVDFGVIDRTQLRITELGLRSSSAQWVPANSVIVAMYGATAAKAAVTAIPLTTNQACCNLEIDPGRAEFRYVFHWIVQNYARLRSLGEGSQSNLNAQKVKAFPIAVPSLDEQRRIVDVLDHFDSLVASISIGLPAEIAARRKQYEHYLDWLFDFERLAA